MSLATSTPTRSAPETSDTLHLDALREQAYAAARQGAAMAGLGATPWLLAGLKEHQTALQDAVTALRSSEQEVLSHAAEWLLDNYFLAQEALRQIREDMPRTFYHQLPKLTAGSSCAAIRASTPWRNTWWQPATRV